MKGFSLLVVFVITSVSSFAQPLPPPPPNLAVPLDVVVAVLVVASVAYGVRKLRRGAKVISA